MPADIASKPYDVNKEYAHAYICKKYPMLRLVFKRKEKQGDVEQYVGFLKHAPGGIFQTNDSEVAAFLDEIVENGEHGHLIEKIDHAELGALMSAAEPERARVNRGPTSSRQTEKSEVPPDEGEERAPTAAKGPKRGRPAKETVEA